MLNRPDQYIGLKTDITDISASAYVFSGMRQSSNNFLRTEKNAWNSDLKWCIYIVCQAEGYLLFNNY